MPSLRTRDPTWPPRLARLIALLAQRPYTIKELATALGVTPKTARSYMSVVSRHHEIQAEGPYGATRYQITPLKESS